MATDRDAMLSSLRMAQPPPTPLPDFGGIGVRFPDPRARFAQSLAEVGGRCVFVPAGERVADALARLPEYASGRRVASLVPGVRGNVDLASVPDPHQLEDLDFCVLPGLVGVAESGAVWVTERGTRNRAGWFLAQHTAIVLRAADIVHDLHEAYARIAVGGAGFAMFISGPSKTADIEQALVIGAQGPRSCTAFVVDG